MKHTELVKGKVYQDLTDKDIPLMFTGKITGIRQYGEYSYVCHFTPVETGKNRTWYNSVPLVKKLFSPEYGNRYIKCRHEKRHWNINQADQKVMQCSDCNEQFC